MGHSYHYLSVHLPEQRVQHLENAVRHNAGLCAAWAALGQHHYHNHDWINCMWACHQGIHQLDQGAEADQHTRVVLYDTGAIACDRLGLGHRGVLWGQQALALAPEDARLINNMTWYRKTAQGESEGIMEEGVGFEPTEDAVNALVSFQD